MTTKTTTTTELGSKLAYLTRALKTPTITRSGKTSPPRPGTSTGRTRST